MGIIDENWNYEIDIEECEKNSNSLFVLKHINLRERGLKDLDSNFINIVEEKESKARNNDEELTLLTKRNKELNQEIETKRKLKTQQKTEIENFKRDQKLLLQEVKQTHEAFLLARKHYKKCLNIHYSIETRCKETRVILIQFFTEQRNKGQQYAVYLLKNVMSQQYTLESINPTLKNFKELQRKLQETNDVSGILCCIRQAFLAHKLKDKDH